jgi:hypothetical protein
VVFISGYNVDRQADRMVLPRAFHADDFIVAVPRMLLCARLIVEIKLAYLAFLQRISYQ